MIPIFETILPLEDSIMKKSLEMQINLHLDEILRFCAINAVLYTKLKLRLKIQFDVNCDVMKLYKS